MYSVFNNLGPEKVGRPDPERRRQQPLGPPEAASLPRPEEVAAPPSPRCLRPGMTAAVRRRRRQSEGLASLRPHLVPEEVGRLANPNPNPNPSQQLLRLPVAASLPRPE